MGGEPGDDDISENGENEEQDDVNSGEAEGDRHQYFTYQDVRAEVQKMKEQPEVSFSVICSM
jgi:hypothetical protein